MSHWSASGFGPAIGKIYASQSDLDREKSLQDVNEFYVAEYERRCTGGPLEDVEHIPKSIVAEGLPTSLYTLQLWLSPGAKQMVADIMSRVPEGADNADMSTAEIYRYNGVSLNISDMSRLAATGGAVNDKVICAVIGALQKTNPKVWMIDPLNVTSILEGRMGQEGWSRYTQHSKQAMDANKFFVRYAFRSEDDQSNQEQTLEAVFLPVHTSQSGHWSLIVLHPQSLMVRYYDSMTNVIDEGRAKARRTSMLNDVVRWLDNIVNRWSIHEGVWKWEVAKCAQQDELSCGVYVCAYATAIIRGLDLLLQIPDRSGRVLRNYFVGILVSNTGD